MTQIALNNSKKHYKYKLNMVTIINKLFVAQRKKRIHN